ncbi:MULTISPECIES: formamidase [Gordonia]|jgi:formamidase|uniref:Aliphatic amidase n=2 Tax=Gordonia TaxID=2053 RepID=K6W0Y6_9ACTN|nr:MULTISPECIES: formamidase [Gordonia]AZZ83292.1 formamidase [Gordonia alkanivorans]MCK8615364.1 formamidase [Gordonia sp. C13]MDH3051749.1 formamidase [Gordonia alkanivorans]GAA14602.1 aliphatic amidase [Gordonia alkanivorans NBRC 16433]GAC02204.1 aliphatic amidase [Gordonia namibiensis NBRC 108229]
MSGLDGLNPSPGALVLGLVQARVPTIREPGDLKETAERLAGMVRNAKKGMPSIDLVVMPEYSINGLDPDTWLDDTLLCDRDGPEMSLLADACREAGVWGCFSIMERNPAGAPWNSGIIIDDQGCERLYYRKMHPWVPAEPWAPGDLGIPVCDGPSGSRLALIICHDGMFPEMAREAAYKGANVILRTAGYTYPIQQSWRITNQTNAFHNLAYTASVALAGPDQNNIWSQGEAMVCDVDGTVLVSGDGTPDRVVTAEVVPSRADDARRTWGVENNIYQLGHRGYTAVAGGASDCPYTFMRDLVAGEYRVPWESEVAHVDGKAAGWGAPDTVRAR